MTVGELERRMTMRELAEWMAFTRYYQAIPNPWLQTGLLTSALLAPHSEKGKAPKASDFNPIDNPPQHRQQMIDVIEQLNRDLGG
jgi:hypothetical protein